MNLKELNSLWQDSAFFVDTECYRFFFRNTCKGRQKRRGHCSIVFSFTSFMTCIVLWDFEDNGRGWLCERRREVNLSRAISDRWVKRLERLPTFAIRMQSIGIDTFVNLYVQDSLTCCRSFCLRTAVDQSRRRPRPLYADVISTLFFIILTAAVLQ